MPKVKAAADAAYIVYVPGESAPRAFIYVHLDPGETSYDIHAKGHVPAGHLAIPIDPALPHYRPDWMLADALKLPRPVDVVLPSVGGPNSPLRSTIPPEQW